MILNYSSNKKAENTLEKLLNMYIFKRKSNRCPMVLKHTVDRTKTSCLNGGHVKKYGKKLLNISHIIAKSHL